MTSELPSSLFKYLPSKFLDSVLLEGNLLFRNLTYFRQYESTQRGDWLEGHHRDNPDNDIIISNHTKRTNIQGDFSFLNTTNTDLIYVFCVSKTFKPSFYDEFECDCCIEITNVSEFVRRVRIAVRRLFWLHSAGLLYGSVHYYKDNQKAEFNIKNPIELVFAKNVFFESQDEFRLVFGRKKAFNLEQKIVINDKYDFRAEALKGKAREKMIKIGNISDITNIHKL